VYSTAGEVCFSRRGSTNDPIKKTKSRKEQKSMKKWAAKFYYFALSFRALQGELFNGFNICVNLTRTLFSQNRRSTKQNLNRLLHILWINFIPVSVSRSTIFWKGRKSCTLLPPPAPPGLFFSPPCLLGPAWIVSLGWTRRRAEGLNLTGRLLTRFTHRNIAFISTSLQQLFSIE
jgi:hypothetical protein